MLAALKMKILLINPPKFGVSKDFSSSIYPPLGLLYMASVLRNAGHTVKVIDAFVLFIKDNYNLRKFVSEVQDFEPDVIGVSCFTSNIGGATKMLDAAKNAYPDAITLIGGPHITAVPNYLINVSSADYGVFGEAEYTLLEFVNKLSKNKPINNVAGVIYRDGNSVRYTLRKYIDDLDDLPLPARDLVPMHLYQPSSATYRQLPSTVIITSRGCPFQCIFCHKPIFGNKFRPHSAKRVVEEIEHLHHDFGINDFRIYDDTFTLQRERVVEICNLLIEKSLGITWNCTTRVDRVDYDLLKLMKKAGCYNVSYGVESGSKRILKLLKKGITKKQVINAFNWTKRLGIENIGFFVLGVPTETSKEIMQTIKFAKKLNPDYVAFSLITPFPDTKLYDLCKEHGKVTIGDWSNFVTYSDTRKELPFVPFTVSQKELKKLYRRAYLEFYFRPKFILNKLNILFNSDKPIERIKKGLKVIMHRL